MSSRSLQSKASKAGRHWPGSRQFRWPNTLFVQWRGSKAAGRRCRQPHQKTNSFCLHQRIAVLPFWKEVTVCISWYTWTCEQTERNGRREACFLLRISELYGKKAAKGLFQMMRVLRQYLNIMCLFDYDANDKRQLSKRKNQARLKGLWKRQVHSSSPLAKVVWRLWSLWSQLSTTVRVVEVTCLWRLFLVILKTQKSANGAHR